MKDNTKKSGFGNITPEQFGNMVFGREDERKAKCIHCGDVWYAMHYKDGVCHSCQQKKLPGRTQIAKSGVMKLGITAAVIIAILAIIYLCS